MTDLSQTESVKVTLINENGHHYDDWLAEERPLNVWINGEPYVTLMRTPGDDQALVYGFLKTDGVIEDLDDVDTLSLCHRGTEHPQSIHQSIVSGLAADRLKACLASGVRLDPKKRNHYVSSSCGLCSLEELEEKVISSFTHPLQNKENWQPISLTQEQIRHLIERFNRDETLYTLTGGAHAAALFTKEGQLKKFAVDIGRHNAVDKVIGGAMIDGVDCFSGLILFVSSRAGFEIVSKASSAGVSALVTLGAASGGAHRLAVLSGLPLYSFARHNRVHRHQAH